MSYIRGVGANVNNFDARIFDYDLPRYAADEYLGSTTSGLYEVIHITKLIWVVKLYEAEKFEDYTYYYSFILQKNIPLLVFVGEFDM